MLHEDNRCGRSTNRCHKPVKPDQWNKGFDIYRTKSSCCKSAHVRGSSTKAGTVDRLMSYEDKRAGRWTGFVAGLFSWVDGPPTVMIYKSKRMLRRQGDEVDDHLYMWTAGKYGLISRYEAAYIRKRKGILKWEVGVWWKWKARDGGWGPYLCDSRPFVIWK